MWEAKKKNTGPSCLAKQTTEQEEYQKETKPNEIWKHGAKFQTSELNWDVAMAR